MAIEIEKKISMACATEKIQILPWKLKLEN
jgi:hypothetical protein